jgi:hypothetical protein
MCHHGGLDPMERVGTRPRFERGKQSLAKALAGVGLEDANGHMYTVSILWYPPRRAEIPCQPASSATRIV